MNCLVCGHKLAIFRKLSLGDFCCQEHRALFLKDQNDLGLARLMESSAEPKSRVSSATRVYAQFLHEEVQASVERVAALAHGPLAATKVMIAPETVRKCCTQLAPPVALFWSEPESGVTSPIYFEAAGISLRLPAGRLPVLSGGGSTRLRQAGLILPWSGEAGPHTAFSLAPLVAAAWANSGYSRPISPRPFPLGAVHFAWPRIQGKVELPVRAREVTPAAFAAMEGVPSQPGRVRLATPSPAKSSPKLELALPLPVRVEDQPAPVSQLEPSEAAPAVPPVLAPPANPGWLAQFFLPKPEKVLSARARTRARIREDAFNYDDPMVPTKSTSGDAWRAMMSGWTPSAAVVSGMFAVLFLLSVVAIFLSVPSSASLRSPSWRWSSLRNAIRSRSVLRLEDDFRAGLSGWKGPSSLLDWSYDQAGFLRPGRLGFLQQSMNLVNYRMELLGQIERKSLGWAFRAKDDNNYYVAKLTITKPGPLPMVSLIHYPVTDGKEGVKISVALPFAVRNDTLYQVEMNIHDDQFRASVNGHVVDSWSDRSLRAGGVGFVSGKGEAARVRWIRVSERDDFLGHVCSYLSARYDRPADDPALSASFYAFLRVPGQVDISR
jgi:hypothetical protein